MGFITDAIGSVGNFVGDLVGAPVKGIAHGVTSQVRPQDVQNFVNPQMINSGQYQNAANQYQGGMNPGAQAQTGQQQAAFARALMDQAQGKGPSPTATMLQQAQQQNAQNSAALAASQRGTNPGLAMRQALQGNAAANQQAAGQAAVARQQEQLNAQGQLGNVLAQQRGADIQNTMGMGQLANQSRSLGLEADRANQAAGMGAAQFNTNAAYTNAGYQNQVVGGMLDAIGGGMGKMIGKSQGGVIPGKAPVPGDSPKNDVVDAKLSPGEIVIPRTAAEDADKAKAFIDSIMKAKKGETGEGFGKVLEAHRNVKSAMAELEKALGKKRA